LIVEPDDGSEQVVELRPQSPRRGEEVVRAASPLVRTEIREDLGRPLWALMAFGLWHDAWASAPCRRPVESPILQEAA